MKRHATALTLSLLLALSLLTGCGASSSGGAAAAGDTASSGAFGPKASFAAPQEAGEAQSYSAAAANGGAEQPTPAKRIYTAELTMETTAFDDTAASLAGLVEACGGYFEASSVGNYASGYRSGWYTIRIPVKQFDNFCAQAGKLCHLLSQSSEVEDVSEFYYDTAGRLKTQQIKLERLQSLLAKADKMEDILTIENAISETEQEIESLSGTLRRYDALVDYSTVSLSLEEVYRLSNTEEPATGFASRLGTALSSGAKGFVSFLQGVLLALAYGWVWVILAAAAGALGVSAARKRCRAKGGSQAAAPAEILPKNGDKSGEL